jgi:hypothetical protein
MAAANMNLTSRVDSMTAEESWSALVRTAAEERIEETSDTAGSAASESVAGDDDRNWQGSALLNGGSGENGKKQEDSW